MVTSVFLDSSILHLFFLFILYVIPIKRDLFFPMIFILVWKMQLTLCLTCFANYFHFEISVTLYTLDAYYHRTVAWKNRIIQFIQMFKCSTPFKCVHSNLSINLLLYKLIPLMILCCLHEFSDYCDYFDKVLDWGWTSFQ